MPFKVELVKQKSHFEVGDDENILAAALRHGHQLPYGCRAGKCGACKATLVTGSYDYPNGSPKGISAAEQAQDEILLCQAHARSDVAIKTRIVTSPKDIHPSQFSCRVASIKKLSPSVVGLHLELPKAKHLQFLAGQYIDILMNSGRRSFSLANPPHQDQLLELHIQYYKGGLFSEYVFHELKEKTILRVAGPLGQFTLQQSKRPIIMIAGGTGFAPIKSLVEDALHHHDKREITIYWGARAAADLYLHELAQKWACDYPQVNYIPVLSQPTDVDNWPGRVGLVHDAVLADYKALSPYDVYTCGPPPMITAVADTLPGQGLKKDRLFSDAFEFSPR